MEAPGLNRVSYDPCLGPAHRDQGLMNWSGVGIALVVCNIPQVILTCSQGAEVLPLGSLDRF